MARFPAVSATMALFSFSLCNVYAPNMYQSLTEETLFYANEASHLGIFDVEQTQGPAPEDTDLNDNKAGEKQTVGTLQEVYPNKKVFVCITGQVQRLILREKIATVFQPLQEAGCDLDIALVVSEGLASFVNGFEGKGKAGNEVETWEQAADLLKDYNVLPYRIPPLTATLERMNNTFYERNLNKRRGRLDKAYLHMKQMETISHCMDAVPRDQDYAFHLRIRDDVALAPPLNATRVLGRFLENTRPTIMASDCNTWHGMNDRFALVTSDAAEAYYRLPYEGLANNDTIPIRTRYNVNAERFYYELYKRANITVLPFQGLRNVFKVYWIPQTQSVAISRRDKYLYRCPDEDEETGNYKIEVI
ncbi:MAG: hypothetical protein AAFR36_27465 [Bacteroidota bacterium]